MFQLHCKLWDPIIPVVCRWRKGPMDASLYRCMIAGHPLSSAHLGCQQRVITNSTDQGSPSLPSLNGFDTGKQPPYLSEPPSALIAGLAWGVVAWLWTLELAGWGGALALPLTA